MKQFFSFIVVFSFAFNLFSQQKGEFIPLSSKGPIPSEIVSLNENLYKTSIRDIKKKGKEKNIQQEFYLKTDFQIGNLLKSGNVLFGDSLTRYVNKIVDYILKDHSDLRKKLKVYVLKSPDVNAFSTQQGYLFVNVGLLAQVENEAQLAFVLSHEIIHYVKNHNLNSYLYRKKLSKGKGELKSLSYREKLDNYLYYSKDNEMEADKLGFEDYFIPANYDVNEAINVFDILLYSYLPFDEIVFDTTFFNDTYFHIPSDYFLKKTKEITAIEDYNDKYSTHPNIKVRRQKFLEYISETDDVPQGKKYIISEKEFKETQKIARFELNNLFLVNLDYGKAIYNSYLLLRQYPNNIYLQRTISYALYALSKYKTYHKINDVLPQTDSVEGKSQQLFSILNHLTKKELLLLALRQNWKLYKKYNHDNNFGKLYKDLLHDLVFKYKDHPVNYVSKLNTSIKPFKEISTEEYEALNKYQKIKYDKKLKASKNNTFDLKYALVDLMQDKEFVENFKNLTEEAKVEDTLKKVVSKRKRKKKKINININRKTNEPVNQLLVYNPFFIVYKNHSDIDYISSEQRKLQYMNLIKTTGEKAGIKIDILDPYLVKNTSDYDKVAIMNDWLSEFISHQQYDDFWDIINSQDIYVNKLTESYGDHYISFLFNSLLLQAPHDVYQVFFTVDIRTGEVILANSSKVNSSYNSALFKSYLYDMFHSLKTSKL